MAGGGRKCQSMHTHPEGLPASAADCSLASLTYLRTVKLGSASASSTARGLTPGMALAGGAGGSSAVEGGGSKGFSSAVGGQQQHKNMGDRAMMTRRPVGGLGMGMEGLVAGKCARLWGGRNGRMAAWGGREGHPSPFSFPSFPHGPPAPHACPRGCLLLLSARTHSFPMWHNRQTAVGATPSKAARPLRASGSTTPRSS